MRCALINSDGDVLNVIVANHETDPAPAGFLFVPLKEGSRVSAGEWKYDADNQRFICILSEAAAYQ